LPQSSFIAAYVMNPNEIPVAIENVNGMMITVMNADIANA
jgi:hypothetical protein